MQKFQHTFHKVYTQTHWLVEQSIVMKGCCVYRIKKKKDPSIHHLSKKIIIIIYTTKRWLGSCSEHPLSALLPSATKLLLWDRPDPDPPLQNADWHARPQTQKTAIRRSFSHDMTHLAAMHWDKWIIWSPQYVNSSCTRRTCSVPCL